MLSAQKLRIELINTEPGLFALEPEWNSLLRDSRSNSVFLTWEWVSKWWECFGNECKPMILVARSETGELLGLTPLILHYASLIPGSPLRHRELAFLGANSAAPDHLDFILRRGYEDSLAVMLVDRIVSSPDWDILRLDGLASDSPLVSLLVNRMKSWGSHVFQKPSALIQLPNEWDEFLVRLGKNLRKNINRYSQRLEKDFPGQIRYRQIQDEVQLKSALADVLRLAQEVKEAHHEKYSLDDPKLQEFLRRVMIEFRGRNWLRLYTLDVGGSIIAASICFQYNKVTSIYQSGYDLAWKSYSPGQQIRAYCIQQAIMEGARECDFLRGEHNYKNEWANETKTDVYLKIGFSLYGKILVSVYAAARRFRGWVRSLKQQPADYRLSSRGNPEILLTNREKLS